MLLVLAAACHRASTSGPLAGAVSPRAAVEQFLAAAKAQDMQAIGAVWGDENGAMRDRTKRDELEKREVVMLSLLRHDQARLSEPAAAPAGRVTMLVDLTQGQLKANVKFTTAKGPSNRWFVADFDTGLLQNQGFGGKRPR
ncbi:MAG: hypothetical protein ACHQQ3_13485 [Gemmatimonadales bacterium]